MSYPPYGNKFKPAPKSGVRVAIGPGAWDFAEAFRRIPNGWSIPIMVLPEGEAASYFTWPSDSGPALIYERGEAKGKLPSEEASDRISTGVTNCGC